MKFLLEEFIKTRKQGTQKGQSPQRNSAAKLERGTTLHELGDWNANTRTVLR